jgi:hypothetical protein
MASDNERYEDIPQELDDRGNDVDKDVTPPPTSDGPPLTDFPERWDAEPDATTAAAEDFGERWSGQPDNSAEKAEEFGERWAGGLDDSGEHAEEFGATWSGDNQADANG